MSKLYNNLISTMKNKKQIIYDISNKKALKLRYALKLLVKKKYNTLRL